MTRRADWYFDYVSPYPYLQLAKFASLPDDLVVRPRPVLFAALLNHWGHLGPAEIPEKARQTYYMTRWMAERRGLPFAGPPRHPFNPLQLLRLTLHLGATVGVVRAVYDAVWGEGRDGEDKASVAAIAASLGVGDLSPLSDPGLKQALRANTAEAIGRGVYGVPTFAMDGRLFWGDDATGLFIEWLDDPGLFDRPAFARLEGITPASARPRRDS